MQPESNDADPKKDESTPVAPTETITPAEPAEKPQGEWAYTPDKSEEQAAAPVQQQEPEAKPAEPAAPKVHHDTVSWTASEYIAHHKSPVWYAVLAVVAVAVGGVVYWITQDKIAVGVVVVMAVLFGVSAARPPRVLPYEINDKGVIIGTKHYDFSMFRSFSVVDDGPFSSITLLSTKRYMPPLSIYYPHEFEEKIIEKLSDVLPFEHKEADFVERLMRRIHF